MITPDDIPRVDSRVRTAVYEIFASGQIPARLDVARLIGIEERDVASSYERLADSHVLVLDPTTREVWMAMPFSAVATAFVVAARDRQWWANCAWDAMGISAALQCDVRVETTCADCREPMTVTIANGELMPAHGVAHFAVPAAEWWNDIGFT